MVTNPLPKKAWEDLAPDDKIVQAEIEERKNQLKQTVTNCQKEITELTAQLVKWQSKLDECLLALEKMEEKLP